MKRMMETREPTRGSLRFSTTRARRLALGLMAAVALQGCTGEPSDDELTLAAEAGRQTGVKAVLDWHLQTESSIAGVAKQPPWISSYGFAMVHGAVYDAVNAIERTHQPYLVAPPAKRWYSTDAAVATAAYRVLSDLVPDQQPTLKQRYDASLAAISNGAAKLGGIGVGERAAAAMIAARTNDGRNGTVSAPVTTEPGRWRATPPAFAPAAAPWAGDVKPFISPAPELFRTEGPYALTSEAYARELEEVREIGSRTSTTRNADQTDAAIYWERSPWGEIARNVAVSQRLNAGQAARLFAMVSLVRADAFTACFNDKYFWNTWRPVSAIQEAANDGNPATNGDSTWTPLLDTPPFPEHPSAHSCGSSAAGVVFNSFFGRDNIAFSATSTFSNTTRSFTGFSQALAEIVEARIWGGIHFRNADVQGEGIGVKVAAYMLSHYFQPLR